MNTGDSLLRPDNIAGIPYSGAGLLVFCFPMVLWRILMLFSSALKTFPMLLKCCFSFSEREAAWPAFSFKSNPRLFLQETHRKRMALKPEGGFSSRRG